jgi:hypothetical protein
MADQATCFNCGKDVEEESFCHGCEHYVCDECDQNHGLLGAHDEEDHLNDPDEEEDEDDDDLEDEDDDIEFDEDE